MTHKMVILFVVAVVIALFVNVNCAQQQLTPITSTDIKSVFNNMKSKGWMDDQSPLSPFYAGVDCGEETALLQRNLQLELFLNTSKTKFITTLNDGDADDNSTLLSIQQELLQQFINGDFTFDTPLSTIMFASCNHQNRAQELWNNMVLRTSENKDSSNYFPIPQLFLWGGDFYYADRPPNPSLMSPNSQRTDALRQMWRHGYCHAVRRQIPVQGVTDDHDSLLNDSDFFLSVKDRGKQLLLDSFDFPDALELGVSRQFRQVAIKQCGIALKCAIFINPERNDDDGGIGHIDNIIINNDCLNNIYQTANQIATSDKNIKSFDKEVLNNCNPTYSTHYTHGYNPQGNGIYEQLYRSVKTFVSPHIFSPTNSTEFLSIVEKSGLPLINNNITNTINYIEMYQDYMQNDYKMRRLRHGTYSHHNYGPLFRRVKTIMLDVRVGQIVDDRMLLESQWRWFEEQLNNSIIPTITEVYTYTPITTTTTTITNEKTNELYNFIQYVLQNHTAFNITNNGARYITYNTLYNNTVYNETLYKDILQCNNTDYNLSSFLSILSKQTNYIEESGDFILIDSGLLITSWGKWFSEGWRVMWRERSRFLELTSRYSTFSRQRVEEWQIFIQLRQKICGDIEPILKYQASNKDSRNNHQQQNTNNKTIIQVKLSSAIKPLALAIITGDIHYSESARSYIGVNIDIIKEDNINKKYKTNYPYINYNNEYQYIKNYTLDKQYYTATNDTLYNSKLSLDSLKKQGKTVTATLRKYEMLYGGLENKNFNNLVKRLQNNMLTLEEQHIFNIQYIQPSFDITTSGVTHGWAGPSRENNPVLYWLVDKIFRVALPPRHTNVDFRSELRDKFIAEDLKYLYMKEEEEEKNKNNKNTNQQHNNNDDKNISTTTQSIFNIRNYTKDDFSKINSQEEWWLNHNIGHLDIDWENDIAHFKILNKDLDIGMYYSQRMEHLRAYSIPQIVSMRYREFINPTVTTANDNNDILNYDETNDNDDGNDNEEEGTTNKILSSSTTKTTKKLNKKQIKKIESLVGGFIHNIHSQMSHEIGQRARKPFVVGSKGLIAIVLSILIFIISLLVSCCYTFCPCCHKCRHRGPCCCLCCIKRKDGQYGGASNQKCLNDNDDNTQKQTENNNNSHITHRKNSDEFSDSNDDNRISLQSSPSLLQIKKAELKGKLRGGTKYSHIGGQEHDDDQLFVDNHNQQQQPGTAVELVEAQTSPYHHQQQNNGYSSESDGDGQQLTTRRKK